MVFLEKWECRGSDKEWEGLHRKFETCFIEGHEECTTTNIVATWKIIADNFSYSDNREYEFVYEQRQTKAAPIK